MGKKKNIGIFCMIIAAQCLAVLIWGSQKVRLNVDEMFTMEGAKQGGKGYQYWDLAENFYGSEHTNEEFLEHMTVNSDDILWNQGAGSVISAFLERDFYYVMINLVSIIYPGHVPWAIGVGLNLIFFIIAQGILYLITKELINASYALCAVAVYGFSAGAISTVLYVRCYMFLVLCVLLLIYLYMRLVKTEKGSYKLLYLLCLAVLAFLCYEIHEFGTVLFAVITCLFVVYILLKKDKKTLFYLLMGYGIPFLLAHNLIIYKLKIFFVAGVAPLFYSIASNMTFQGIVNNLKGMILILSDHLFVNIWIMMAFITLILVAYTGILRFKGIRSQMTGSVILADKLLCAVPAVICSLYYMILLIGGAVAWKYFSPGYPLIVLSAVILASFIFSTGTKKVSFICKAVTGIVSAGCIILSYNAGHISELYLEEQAIRDMLDEKYQGVNGVMVHHDTIGDGENWLYEAASLWPQDSNVLVIQNKVLRAKELCYNREDDKILLWLTIDYDMDEALKQFKECTEYKSADLILNTDHLWIYECKKE